MAATMFGFGTPSSFPISPALWGLSPYGGAITAGVGPQHLQQIQQLIQVVPQQLHQVQALQQQQLLYLQQLLQIVPAQLQQLQQLIQILSQQAQVLQPIGQSMPGPLGYGMVPQVFAGQAPTHVM
jgi:predicted PurR-regulated permease PerM